MKQSQSLLFFFVILLMFPAAVRAQSWSGIISPSRASDWTGVGIPGGPPDASWTQCGSTIAAYSGTTTKISNQLASCSANQYVLLGSGTFNLTGGIQFPQNTTGHVVLRGSGANSTFLNFSGGGFNCGGFDAALICAESSDGTYPGEANPTSTTWTAGYAQGATQITLSSVSGIVLNQTLLFLNQCDTGFSGSACTTGSATDNGGYFVCSAVWNGTTGCSVSGPDGSTWRANAWQQEVVTVTAINAGGCGATCVTISQPLKHPNWSSGQSPQAVFIQPLPQDGVENLAIDGTGTGTSVSAAIQFYNAYQGWVSGVRISNIYEWGVNGIDVSHMLIQNNYIYHSNGHPDAYAIRIQWGGDNLVQNNIVQQFKISTSTDGPSSGDVFAYNFTVNQLIPAPTDFMWGSYWTHAAGDDFQLWEGNIGNQMQNDNVHGSHLNETKYRNFFTGWESCANGQCGSSAAKDSGATAMVDSSNVRYANNIANVLGTPSYTTNYQSNVPFSSTYVYNAGGGGTNAPPTPTDSLVASTMLRWANWDNINNSVRCNTAEIPTSAPSYPNSIPTLGCGGGALPASFYLTSRPSWFGSLPWPPIGPDVTGGNVGQCSGTLNTPGQYAGLPATSASQCKGSSVTASAWAGHVNANPAMACYISMGGVPDGTGSVLSFNANSCYGGSTSPSQSAPQPPTNLVIVVN